MTALNFTIGRDFAVLSQDRKIALTAEPLRSMVGEFSYHQKLYFDRESLIASGVRGNMLFAGAWYLKLGSLVGMDAAELADAHAWLRPIFSVFKRDFGIGRQQVIAAGWSQREGRIVSFLFDSDDEFNPLALDQGHTLAPAPRLDAMCGAEIWEKWTAALDGPAEALHFHDRVMSNQVHQVDCGFIRVDNMVLGGYGDAVVIRDGTMEVRTVQDEVPYDFKGMDS